MPNKKEREKKPSSWHTVFSVVKYLIPIGWKCSKKYFILDSIRTINDAIRPFIYTIFFPLIIDELLGERNINKLIILSVLFLGGTTFCDIVFTVLKRITGKQRLKLENIIKIQMSMHCLELDFESTEDPKLLDMQNKASEGIDWYSGGISGIWEQLTRITSSFITLVGALIIVLINVPLVLVFFIVCVILSTFVNSQRNKIDIKFWEDLSPINRRFSYFSFNLSNFNIAKDIRLYGAVRMLIGKVKDFNKLSTKMYRKTAYGKLPLQITDEAISALRMLSTNLYLGWLVISKTISIGTYTMVGNAGSNVTYSLFGIIRGVQEIQKRCVYAKSYVDFMTYISEDGVMEDRKTPTFQTHLDHVIELRNVSFKYPRTENWVLKNISMTLTPHEKLSIVGLNGAGKTTFIKLLCRLYKVTDGEILLDGVNINDYPYDEYIKLFSVVFQDFKIFAFSLKENILRDKYDKNNTNLTDLWEQVGLSDKLSELENKDETSIFKSFDEKGIEPSGGEQQKLAIARSLYKDAPIIILDEPTAALDPIAEFEIYRQFDALVGNKTAIYISHRLSSCKFCDKIIVFKDGIIAEEGTHDKLVNIEGGVYSEMFMAQAQYYR